MFPTTFGMKECGIDNKLGLPQKREVIVSLIPNIPVREKPVTFKIASNVIPLRSGICVKADQGELNSCAIKIWPYHSADRPLTFKLRTVCNTVESVEPQDTVEFTFNTVEYNGENNEFWLNYQLPTIKVGCMIKMILFSCLLQSSL